MTEGRGVLEATSERQREPGLVSSFVTTPNCVPVTSA